MFDKVTDAYETKGEARYFMSLPATEHAEAIFDMSYNGMVEISRVDVETVNGVTTFDGWSENLERILLDFSPQVNVAVFDIVYDGFPLTVYLHYQRKEIRLMVDPATQGEDKHRLAEFFRLLMGADKCAANEEFEQFTSKIGLIVSLSALVLTFVIPILSFLWMMAAITVISSPKIQKKIWGLWNKHR